MQYMKDVLLNFFTDKTDQLNRICLSRVELKTQRFISVPL